MGEWTWLHAVFPLADIELTQPPLDPHDANVLVRTVRRLPPADTRRVRANPDAAAVGPALAAVKDTDPPLFEVRVAPHHVAPFRGGPWLGRFEEQELEHPGLALEQFRAKLAHAVEQAHREADPSAGRPPDAL